MDYPNPLWLAWNNFVYLLLIPWMVYVSTYRADIKLADWSWELKFVLALTVASTFNHLCSDPYVQFCIGGLNSETLIIFDIYCALTALNSVISIQLRRKPRKIFLPFITFVTMILCLCFPNGNIPMGVIFSMASLTYLYYRAIALYHFPKNHWSAVLGLILFGVAIVFKQVLGNYPLDTPDHIDDYSLYHGIWHILSAFSAALLIWDARFTPDYYVIVFV